MPRPQFPLTPYRNIRFSLTPPIFLLFPRHVHFEQAEHFKVEQGILGAVVDGKEYALTKDDGILSIYAGSR